MKKMLAAFVAAVLILPSVFGASTKTEFTVVNGAEPQSIDPAHMQTNTDQRIFDALFEGLVVYDAKTNEAKPGVAESWKVDKDGKTYTFKLRKAVFTDGTPITAQTFVDSWLREMDPKTAGEYADTMASYVEGGSAFNGGKAGPETVKMKAVDPQTFQVTMVGPIPTMSLLAHQMFSVVPMHIIAKVGQEWTKPENFVGNGPFTLKEWVPQSKIVVVPNPKYWDAKSVKLTKITFLPLDDNNTGYNMYKKGEVDWMTTVPLDQLDDAQLRKDYHNNPTIIVYYYTINVTESGVKELRDVRVRQALSRGLDRATLVKRVTKAGQLPATSFSPPFSFYTPPALVKDNDIKGAQKLLADAGFPGGKGFPKLTLLYNTSEGHKKIAEYVQDQWKKNLGIDVELKNEEFKTAVDDRNKHNFQIARAGWQGDYADPMTFLDMWTKDSVNNDAGYNNPKYDALIALAKSLQPTDSKRVKAMKEAETLLLTDAPVIPFYFYTAANMLDSSKWSGWYETALDLHPWKAISAK